MGRPRPLPVQCGYVFPVCFRKPRARSTDAERASYLFYSVSFRSDMVSQSIYSRCLFGDVDVYVHRFVQRSPAGPYITVLERERGYCCLIML
jgi:hypothetical protein